MQYARAVTCDSPLVVGHHQTVPLLKNCSFAVNVYTGWKVFYKLPENSFGWVKHKHSGQTDRGLMTFVKDKYCVDPLAGWYGEDVHNHQ